MNRLEYFRAREEATMSPMDYKMAKQLDPDNIVLLDVREGPPSAIVERIPGAINIPLKELAERISGLPKGKRVVVCCWDTWCNLGTKACILLLENDQDAVEMIGGIAAWKTIGFPLENNK